MEDAMGRQLKYDQVKLAILNVIAQDHLKPGDRLPPVRHLLNRVPCSMITLRKSLEMLEDEGMLTRCIGKGTFLNRTVSPTVRNGKILFINVTQKDRVSSPLQGSREYMQHFFNRIGLDFQYLQVECFSDEILKESENALGIMLYGWLTNDFINGIRALQIPMLTVGNSRRFRGIPQVELDIRSGSEQVAECLIRKGAKSLFLLNSSPDYYMHDDIHNGIENAVRRHSSVTFQAADLYGERQSEQLRTLIDRYGGFDAWIIEIGNYFTYLGTCRFYTLPQHPLIGIIGDSGAGKTDNPSHQLFISSPNTVITFFRQSLYETACEQLRELIVNDVKMSSVRIKPEIGQ